MKIEPKAGPDIIKVSTGTIETSGQSAREKAIAKFNEQKAPVQDPNNVSVEELGALKTPEQVQNNTSEVTKAEAAPEAPKEAEKPKEEPALSAQYAQLARKEKALRQQAKDLKAKEEALKQQEQAGKGVEALDPSKFISKDKLSQDLWGTLSDAGVSYDQIVEAVMNQKNQDPALKSYLNRLENEIKELKAGQEKSQKSYEEQQAQNYQQAVSELRNETKRLVQTDQSYEAIRATNSINDVVELIETTYKEDGVLMTVEDAAREVEDHIAEQLYNHATKIKKIQQKLMPKPSAAPAKQQEQKEATKGMNTLTNSVGVTRQLSARERAILAFKGEIKK